MSRQSKIMDAVDSIRAALAVIADHAEPPHMKGYRFEKDFRQMCFDRSLSVDKGDGKHVDMVCNGLRVQCKNVTPDHRGMVYLQPGQSTHYSAEDFDVLAMYDGASLYIVPVYFLPTTNGHISIQVVTASLLRWADAWSVFEGVVPPSRQLGLFQQL
jgi:hypothetical protein